MKKVRKALIIVAGMGTRWGIASKAISKEIMPINGKPAIQYLVEELVSAGVTEIIMVTSEGKEDIERHFEELPSKQAELKALGKGALADEYSKIARLARFYFTQQRDVMRDGKTYPGTGAALLSARRILGDEPFFYLYGDDLWKNEGPTRAQQIQDVYTQYGKSVLVMHEVPEELASNYGIIAGETIEDGLIKITSAVEKPPIHELQSNFAHVSGGILTANFWDYLEQAQPSPRNEIDQFEAVGEFIKHHEAYGLAVKGQWRDVGTPKSAREAELLYWLDEGVGAMHEISAVINKHPMVKPDSDQV